MKKILALLILFPIFAFSEEQPPFEVKDPAITENFRNVYYAVDQLVSSMTTAGYATLSGTQTFTGTNTFPTLNVYQTATGGTTPAVLINDYTSAPGSGKVSLKVQTRADSSANKVFQALSNDGASEVVNMYADGSVTQPSQPSFLVTDGTGASDVTGDDTTYTELWPTEVYDQGSDFASNTFTAPVDGKYILTASVRLGNIAVTHTGTRVLRIVTSNRTLAVADQETLAATYWNRCISAVFDMDAGDTAIVTLSVGTTGKTVDVVGSAVTNFFSGSLLN